MEKRRRLMSLKAVLLSPESFRLGLLRTDDCFVLLGFSLYDKPQCGFSQNAVTLFKAAMNYLGCKN
jgi:hypothetical protein